MKIHYPLGFGVLAERVVNHHYEYSPDQISSRTYSFEKTHTREADEDDAEAHEYFHFH